MDRSFEHNFARGASSPQVGARKSVNSSKSCIQQISPSNANRNTTNFSIFNGPNYIGRNQDNGPQYLNDYKNRQFHQANQSLREQQPQRSNFNPTTYHQLGELKNTSGCFEKTASKRFAEKASILLNAAARNDQIQKPNFNSSFRNNTNQHDISKASTSSNTLGLMGMPKQLNSSNVLNNTHNVSKAEDKGQSGYSSRIKKLGITEAEKMCIFTGTVERVIKWGKIFQNHFCYFEVIAAILSVADGRVPYERTMLLRDRKGPILQVTYYFNATHIKIDDFHLGQTLRVVGRMIGQNIMSALTIRAALMEEHETLPRMCAISDHAVSMLCGNTVL